MKKLIKIVFLIIFCLIILMAGLALITQTDWFKAALKDKLVELANQNINGSLAIKKLEGNFLTRIELQDLSLCLDENDTLLTIKKIEVKYAPLYLLEQQIKIRLFHIDSADIHIVQENDSSYNFSRLIPESNKQIEEEDAKPFAYTVLLDQFLFSNGSLLLNMTDSIIPKKIEDLNIDLKGKYATNDLLLTLNNFSFVSHRPNFYLKSLHAQLQSDLNTWALRDFKMTTAMNELLLDGNYEGAQAFEAKLEWPQIRSEEFSFVLPDIKIPARPRLHFHTASSDGNLDLDIKLQSNNESIALSGTIKQYEALLSDSLRHKASLNLGLKLKDFRPNNWLEIDSLPLLLNTQLQITGNGLSQQAEPLVVKGKLDGTEWEKYLLTRGDIDLSYLAGITSANVLVQGSFGEFATKGSLDLHNEEGPFKLTLNTSNLALHQIMPDIIDSSIVNLSFEASGRGLASGSPSARFKGLIKQSVAEHIPIDTLAFTGSYTEGSLLLDTLQLNNHSLKAAFSAYYNSEGRLKASLQADLFNTLAFESYFEQDALWDRLSLRTDLNGSIDSLYFDLTSTLSKFELDTTLLVESLSLNSEGRLINFNPDLGFNLQASNINAAQQLIDSLRLEGGLKDSLLSVNTAAYLPNEISLMLNAATGIGTEMVVKLSRFDLNSAYADLKLDSDTSYIHYSDSLLRVNNFALIDTKDSLFHLRAEALVLLPDSLQINTDISEFNLALLSHFGIAEQYMKGRANLTLNIDGNAKSFIIDGKTSLKNLELEPLAVSDIRANFYYPGDSARINASIINQLGDSISLMASSPLNIQLSDSLLINWPKTIKAQLTTNRSRLSGFFLKMPGVEQPKALLTMKMDISGHTDKPDIKGFIDISNGVLPLPEYGINYNELRLKASLDNNQIIIDSLYMRHLNGSMVAQGSLRLDSSLLKGSIESSDLSIKARQFYLTHHRDFEIQIDADAFFKDEDDSPRFGGTMNVLRSSFNLPAIIKMTDSGSDLNDPLLIQAIKDAEKEGGELIIDTSFVQPIPEKPKSNLMDKLSGTLRVDIPRNTWIRSLDMQMELYGQLDVVKNSNIFELFGSIGIHRGFYTLYGKRFAIKEGELSFSGGEDFNPSVNLQATYSFRDRARLKRILNLKVSGTAKSPDIAFELDGSSIPEADAMAYLLFGQPFEELNYSNQEGVNNAIPSRLLNSVLSSQLSKTIGSSLKLDMIEIDAGDNWQNTTFMVGKYITNNLFVTYQHRFGESGNESVSPETITLEYELSRRWSVRLVQGEDKESGLDLILKFEK